MMRRSPAANAVLTLVATLVAGPALAREPSPAPPEVLVDGPDAGKAACQVDRTAMLALGEEAFDQDMNGGWRALANKPECLSAAADLIRDYRAAHPKHGMMLNWHEGQLRAASGQTEEGVRLFSASRQSPNEWKLETGWNYYVDAPVAFLQRDITALRSARSRLAALPPPADQQQAVPEARKQGRPEGWPYNLDVVDGLIHCFNRPYKEAINPSCRP